MRPRHESGLLLTGGFAGLMIGLAGTRFHAPGIARGVLLLIIAVVLGLLGYFVEEMNHLSSQCWPWCPLRGRDDPIDWRGMETFIDALRVKLPIIQESRLPALDTDLREALARAEANLPNLCSEVGGARGPA
jgi:hypothetical protein